MAKPPTISIEAIFKFLSIQSDEYLPLVLISLMGFAATSVILWTVIVAREETWDLNWRKRMNADHNKTSADHSSMSDDYASAYDVSQTVAHLSERCCSVVPGMLLVVGLLGTFVGLGVALDIDTANLTQTNELNKALDGVGTKFKTSAWGIIFYLGMRIAIIAGGWEEKRLQWCLKQIGLKKAAVASDLRSFDTGLSNKSQEKVDKFERSVRPILESMRDNIAIFVASNEENMDKIGSAAQSMATAAKSMGLSGDKMKEASRELETAATGLGVQIEAFSNKVDGTLNLINSKLSDSIESMEQTFGTKLGEMAKSMSSSTGKIESTMTTLQSSVEDTMKGVRDVIEKSSNKQEEASGLFQSAAEILIENAVNMADPIEHLSSEIKKYAVHLSESALETNKLAETIIGNITDVNEIQKDQSNKFEYIGSIAKLFDVGGEHLISMLEDSVEDISSIKRHAAQLVSLAERLNDKNELS